jgi:hypothetical protein
MRAVQCFSDAGPRQELGRWRLPQLQTLRCVGQVGGMDRGVSLEESPDMAIQGKPAKPRSQPLCLGGAVAACLNSPAKPFSACHRVVQAEAGDLQLTSTPLAQLTRLGRVPIEGPDRGPRGARRMRGQSVRRPFAPQICS